MSATTIILAAGPTVVGLAALGSRTWEQRRQLRHDREVVDLAAVRSALEDAALAPHRLAS